MHFAYACDMDTTSRLPKKLETFQNCTPAFLCSSACIISSSAGPCDACCGASQKSPTCARASQRFHQHVLMNVRLNTCGCPALAVSAPPRNACKRRPCEGPAAAFAILEIPGQRPGARDPESAATLPRFPGWPQQAGCRTRKDALPRTAWC